MIVVTERARKELKRILSEKVEMPQARLRVLDNGQGGLGIGIDIEAPSDHVVEYEGSRVLVVDHELATSLRGITLDVDDASEVSELVISGKS